MTERTVGILDIKRPAIPLNVLLAVRKVLPEIPELPASISYDLTDDQEREDFKNHILALVELGVTVHVCAEEPTDWGYD